ncbi:hypothetical protein QKV95_gp097 [Poseidoniales virus YSH_150918]|uniref:Uncharacterized protein n=1 Tax=Poseidoniales virus YSH_150918 TaxID=3071324 RepID=A0A976YFC4_9CAUD|nr:hypothetical protein QKV95_gp097 [Yangshan Harbor Poseidoniales virus]UVF62574.1 hypothetical protein [Poseidoniales virus YSH_150918]
MTEEQSINEEMLAILKALTTKVEELERAVYHKDNLLMKSGYVVSQSPTPHIANSNPSPVGDIAKMDWKDIHKMVENIGGQ